MQIEKLILDASGMPGSAAVSGQCEALASKLGDITPKGITKWIERRSIPNDRLKQIAKACSIDPSDYGYKAVTVRSIVYK